MSNGHYRKIDNLDDALKVVAQIFAEMAEKDSSLTGSFDTIEVNGVGYKVQVEVVNDK